MDLPALNEETYLGDGLYVSFDGYCIRLRAPRPHPTDNDAVLDHWVGLDPTVYRALLVWVAQYNVLWEHFAVKDGKR